MFRERLHDSRDRDNKVQTLNLVTCSICTAAASRQGCAGALASQEAAGLLDETGRVSGLSCFALFLVQP
jgi:hypothetical protein